MAARPSVLAKVVVVGLLVVGVVAAILRVREEVQVWCMEAASCDAAIPLGGT